MKACSLKKIYLLFMAGLIICYAMGIAAHAEGLPVPDPERIGSLSVTLQDSQTGEAVKGGSMTLYRVADVKKENSADYSFVLNSEFSGSGEALTTLDAALAERLADYISEKGIAGTSKKADSSGTVIYENLKPGLFLAVQEQAADGYYEIKPFLVTIPLEEDGEYIYDVEATPKMEEMKKDLSNRGAPGGDNVPKNPSPNSPKMGDSTRLMLWFSVLTVSVIAIIIVTVVRRKSEKCGDKL